MSREHYSLISLWVCILCTLAACGADAGAPSTTVSGPIVDRVQAEQDRRDAERRIQMANAIIAQQTASAQATERAFQMQQRQAEASATQQAARLQATVDALNIQATVEARKATLTAEALNASATRQAVSAAASATASAQAVQANLEKAAATATAQAITLAQIKADEDLTRARGDAEFYNVLFKLVAVVSALGFVGFAMYAFNGIINVSLMRRAVIETRNGTLILVAHNGQPSAQVVGAPTLPQLAPGEQPGDEFAKSQGQVIDAESTFIYNANGQTMVLQKPEPDDETDRRLALRLLRESMKLNGPQSDTIPTAAQLKWSDRTRDRATKLIGNYIVTKQGRACGTKVRERHQTLLALYSDVGARRVTLTAPPPNGQP